jgi:hypothetical protein
VSTCRGHRVLVLAMLSEMVCDEGSNIPLAVPAWQLSGYLPCAMCGLPTEFNTVQGTSLLAAA